MQERERDCVVHSAYARVRFPYHGGLALGPGETFCSRSRLLFPSSRPRHLPMAAAGFEIFTDSGKEYIILSDKGGSPESVLHFRGKAVKVSGLCLQERGARGRGIRGQRQQRDYRQRGHARFTTGGWPKSVLDGRREAVKVSGLCLHRTGPMLGGEVFTTSLSRHVFEEARSPLHSFHGGGRTARRERSPQKKLPGGRQYYGCRRIISTTPRWCHRR